MCKYCELKQSGGNEQTNDTISIMSIKDGSQLFDLFMNRCISERKRSNELILDLSCLLNGSAYNVKTKAIKIKYCPFCGEKL